jgi:chemotaxis protein methyltransferase CheR
MGKSLVIQIADDGMELCRELRGWLEAAGHAVTCGPPTRTLVSSMAGHPPGLLIIGLRDVGGAGYALYERLQGHRQLRHLPVMVVSDDADLEYELLDVYDFQARPFDQSRLLNAVARVAATEPAKLTGHLAAEQLEPFKELLRQRSGLHFSASNWRLLERGLQRRMQALQIYSPTKYFNYLASSQGNQDEFNKLVGLLTVGETCFFRYRSHHDALVQQVLPELIERNRLAQRLRLWSAGCSTGEEPYSLAMRLLDHFPQLQSWDVQILATDINKRSLRQAREGVYRERTLRQTEPHCRERYFRRAGDLFQVVPPVRNLVRFSYLNLQEESFPSPCNGTCGIDLILCRNVLIYFQPETIRQIVARFALALNPGGYLFLGHAETLQYISDRFTRHHQHSAFYYQLKMAATDSPVLAPAPASAPPPPPPTRPSAVAAATAGAPPRPPATPPGTAPTPPPAPAGDPEELYRQALTAFDHEQFAAAGQLFDQVLALDPEHPRALVGKGLLCANQGEYQEARQWGARAIRYDDLCPEAYLLRGLILDMEGANDRALVEYQKVLWLDRNFIMAHYFSAKCYGQLGQNDERERALRNTLRALQKAGDSGVVPFSGGLSRPVFLELCRRELHPPD